MKKINDTILSEMTEVGKSGKECAEFFGVSPAAISKRLKRLTPPPKSLTVLTPKEQRFCLEVANGKTQTQAALCSFECSSLQSAKSIGSELMRKSEIEIAISDLMEEAGLTRRYRLKKLREHVDSKSADISLKALDQANRIDGLYAPEKHINCNINIEEISFRRRELEKELAEIREEKRALLNKIDQEEENDN